MGSCCFRVACVQTPPPLRENEGRGCAARLLYRILHFSREPWEPGWQRMKRNMNNGSYGDLASLTIVNTLATKFTKCYHISWDKPGECTLQSFIRGDSAPRSNPLPFYIPYLTKKVPIIFVHFPLTNGYPFLIPSLEFLHQLLKWLL